MPVVASKRNWTIETQESREKKGPLVRVESPTRPGEFVKMHKADADAAGLNYAGKNAPAGANKIKKPQEDKGQAPKPETQPTAPDPAPAADDFTTIPGVGPATDRAIKAAGILSFADLESADLSFLSDSARDSVKDWFNSGYEDQED